MAIISASEIGFFYSGGPNNSNPSLSIGGNPSNFPILGSTNNLFPNVTAEDAVAGKTDYRCFYVFNNSPTAALMDASIYVLSQKSGGSTVEIGVSKTTEVQTVLIAGTVISGNMVFKYNHIQFTVEWDSTANLASNMTAGLASAGVDGAVVFIAITADNPMVLISISFEGDSDNRSHPLLELYENNLDTSLGFFEPPTITISRGASGSPINSVATQLAVDTATPARVDFSSINPDQRIFIGSIMPGDSLPVWVKRTTPADTDFLETDYFTFRVSGSPATVSGSSSSSSSASQVGISYSVQPSDVTTEPTAEVEISCVVVMTGSQTNSPTTVWEMSEDEGATWAAIFPSSEFGFSVSSVSPGTINQSLYLFNVNYSWIGRRFRVTNSEGPVSTTSSQATLTVSCYFTECGGSMGSADCGLVYEPGFFYEMDCGNCECVKKTCPFTECGCTAPGPCASADCGLVPEPGYTYEMDCSICECVKSPVSSSSSSGTMTFRILSQIDNFLNAENSNKINTEH